MRSPKDFFRPLAVGAPEPLREVPWRPSRMIHFFDPSNPKMVAKVPDLAPQVDVLLGNLEDAIKADNKEAARNGLVQIAKDNDVELVVSREVEAHAGIDLGDHPLQFVPVRGRREALEVVAGHATAGRLTYTRMLTVGSNSKISFTPAEYAGVKAFFDLGQRTDGHTVTLRRAAATAK